jgi:hypothetical protein
VINSTLTCCRTPPTLNSTFLLMQFSLSLRTSSSLFFTNSQSQIKESHELLKTVKPMNQFPRSPWAIPSHRSWLIGRVACPSGPVHMRALQRASDNPHCTHESVATRVTVHMHSVDAALNTSSAMEIEEASCVWILYRRYKARRRSQRKFWVLSLSHMPGDFSLLQ